MPISKELIDVHNQFFLSKQTSLWTVEHFTEHCCLNSTLYRPQDQLSRKDITSIGYNFRCVLQKALQGEPPFEKLVISGQEYEHLSLKLSDQQRKTQAKRQHHETASGSHIPSFHNPKEPAGYGSPVTNPVNSTGLLASDTPCPTSRSSKEAPRRPAKRNKVAPPSDTADQSVSPPAAAAAATKTPVTTAEFELYCTATGEEIEVNDGPALLLDEMFEEGDVCVDFASEDSLDIPLQSGDGLAKSINSFQQSEYATEVDDTTQSANISRTANAKNHSNVLLRIMFQHLKKYVVFPYDRQSQTKLLGHFLSPTDLEAMKKMTAKLAQLTAEEEVLFAKLRNIVTVEAYRATDTDPPVGYTPQLLEAWFFMLHAVTFTIVRLPKLLLNMPSRHEGWWETSIWAPLLTSALNSSSLFDFDQRDITSLVDEDHTDINILTPRPRASAIIGTDTTSTATTPTVKTIKYDGVVRCAVGARARMIDPLDLAFLEVKSEACKSSPYIDRVKVLYALRRSLLIIRARLLQKLEDKEEVDRAMADVTTVGILCNGEVATFILANNPHGLVVFMVENAVGIGGEEAWRVAEMAWRVRRTLESTCRVLRRCLEGAGAQW